MQAIKLFLYLAFYLCKTIGYKKIFDSILFIYKKIIVAIFYIKRLKCFKKKQRKGSQLWY